MKTHLLLAFALAGCARPSATQADVAANIVTDAPAAALTHTPAPIPSTAAEVAKPAAPAAPAVDQPFNDQQLALTPAARGVPADVQHFIAAYEECEHWAGEEPYDAARRKEIEDGVNATCTGIDARLGRLNRKYAGDATVSTKLAEYAPVHM